MPFCPNCGAKLDDGVKFCPNCGQAVNGQSQPAQSAVSEEIEAIAVFDKEKPAEGVVIDGIKVGETTRSNPLKFKITRGEHRITLLGNSLISHTKDMVFIVSPKAKRIKFNIKFHMGAFRNKITVDSIVEE